MRTLIGLVCALALLAAALGQGAPTKPPELSVAPSEATTTTAPSNPGAAEGSLDVCKELIAFLPEPQATQPAAGQPAPNAAQRQPPAPQPGGAQGTDAPLPGQTACRRFGVAAFSLPSDRSVVRASSAIRRQRQLPPERCRRQGTGRCWA